MLNIADAEKEFNKLLDRIEPRIIPQFFTWINESFCVLNDFDGKKVNFSTTGLQNERLTEADAILYKISLDIRHEVPLNAVLESENIYWPQIGLDSDCDPKTTVRFIAVHVDSFLYDDDAVDDLVDQGKLSRNYCVRCGSLDVKPLIFFSHSLSLLQLRYIFTTLVPLNANMSGKLILDIGSRLGCVLYASYLYRISIFFIPVEIRNKKCVLLDSDFSEGKVNTVGVEVNKEFCALQNKIIGENNMAHSIKVINDDIRNQGHLVASADVVVLNNVFSFFLPPEEQINCWNFLHRAVRRGAVIVSIPSMEILTEHLQLEFSISDWLDKIDSGHLAARFAGTNEDLFDDCVKITLYSVK
ncbi:unnamed protein product [Dracunculus medinensis]|uniref:CheR domain-containing protein n=1 Tax=Dracunculus medinensis TaxID=318479 RepID=A0A158Q4Q2_DRAME|nr:unnamed protein product [Dracunculus medinensis]